MRLFNAQGALLKRLLKRQPKKQDMMVSNFEIQRRERTQRKTKNRIGRIAFGCRIKTRIDREVGASKYLASLEGNVGRPGLGF